MDKTLFKNLLNQAGLSKKEMSEILGITYGTLANWGSSKEIPYWVESWLNLYIENKHCKELKEIIKEHVCNGDEQ
jgi:DNA-binding transcriptional regulator YiaG